MRGQLRAVLRPLSVQSSQPRADQAPPRVFRGSRATGEMIMSSGFGMYTARIASSCCRCCGCLWGEVLGLA